MVIVCPQDETMYGLNLRGVLQNKFCLGQSQLSPVVVGSAYGPLLLLMGVMAPYHICNSILFMILVGIVTNDFQLFFTIQYRLIP